jgi:hypothetical protein
MMRSPLEASMWLAGWAVRVLLLVAAPVYYLCRFTARAMSRLDEWSWRAIHSSERKKPPQAETAEDHSRQNATRILP